MKERGLFGKMLPVLVVWGTVLCPPDACARAKLLLERSPGLEEALSEGVYAPPGPSPQSESDRVFDEFVQARNESGYVDMDSDGEGDRFVDEDGDGIDDRHMRKHQKRNRQRWRDYHQRGIGAENGEKGSGGQKGYGAGPGRGGR